jgi:hypothetical protein
VGVTLFAVHLGGWDFNPASVSKLSRLDRSFLAPHPRSLTPRFAGTNRTKYMLLRWQDDERSGAMRRPQDPSALLNEFGRLLEYRLRDC